MPGVTTATTIRFALTIATVWLLLLPAHLPAQTAACAVFDSQVWAQSVFASDPARHAALDPDGDGLACEELPAGAAPAFWTDAIPAAAEPASLVGVTDGDTFRIVVAGREEAVRLLLIDAPEKQGPYTRLECHGEESASFLAWLLSRGDLYLERDVTDRDRHGRLLRYAWLDRDGEIYLVNEALVRSGHAPQVTYPPDVAYEDELRQAEVFARGHGYGLWSACRKNAGGATPPEEQLPAGEPARDAGEPCDPAYPTVCIPPLRVQGDLDCRDIPYRRFPVLPPDPHQFDGGGDGIGCEQP
jgi:micrococcal nuclease